MKIAISSAGPSLDAAVDPRFGRCQFLVIMDLDNMSFEAVPNAGNTLEVGAGIQVAKVLIDRGVESVLTGHIGPSTERVLSSAGINVITDVSGTVGEVAWEYKEGKMKPRCEDSVRSDIDARKDRGVAQVERFFQASLPSVGMGRGVGLGGGGGKRHRSLDSSYNSVIRGYCVCPMCGTRVRHEPGRPCFEEGCPHCGAVVGMPILLEISDHRKNGEAYSCSAMMIDIVPEMEDRFRTVYDKIQELVNENEDRLSTWR